MVAKTRYSAFQAKIFNSLRLQMTWVSIFYLRRFVVHINMQVLHIRAVPLYSGHPRRGEYSGAVSLVFFGPRFPSVHSFFLSLLPSLVPPPDTTRLIVARLVNAEISRYLHNIMRAKRVWGDSPRLAMWWRAGDVENERRNRQRTGVEHTRYL